MQDIFSIKYIIFSFQGYDMSFLELIGTIFGLWAVWLSTKEKVSSWYIGILNVICFFWMFYQINLYSDMLLQVYFFVTNLMGWYFWTHPKTEEANNSNQLKINILNQKQQIATGIFIVIGTLLVGLFIGKIHEFAPTFFQQPASFPYLDTFILMASMAAQYLLTKKYIESWILWIAVDVVATGVYFQKNILLTSFEYFIFALIAVKGFWDWRKGLQSLETNIL
jgi:nicotinamide mononucleotide transporter